MMQPRIAITTSSFAPSEAPIHRKLLDAGLHVVENPHGRRLTEDESRALLGDVVGVLAGTSPLNAAVLNQAPRLQVISRCGIGVDSVDLAMVEKKDIALYTTPDAPAQAVAELTFGLIFGLLRRISEADRNLRAGQWQPLMGNLLQGKTVGIIGMGRVGKKLVAFMAPFGVQVLAVDPIALPDDFMGKYDVTQVDMATLLPQADVVTLHVPYTEATHHLIDEAALSKMKPSALLINAARGGVVDEIALATALQTSRLRGAALDTYTEEPYHGALGSMPNVLLTCHMGSYADESRSRMEEEAVDNLLEGLRKKGII